MCPPLAHFAIILRAVADCIDFVIPSRRPRFVDARLGVGLLGDFYFLTLTKTVVPPCAKKQALSIAGYELFCTFAAEKVLVRKND